MSGNSASQGNLKASTLLNARYQIVRRIGGGGMGSVYLAHDTRLNDRLCAVKEMINSSSDESQQAKAVSDFTREAQLLASLEHPSIPTIFDYFIESGRYYLVMNFISGNDLEHEMEKRGGKVDELTVTRWAVQTCDVLAYIHSLDPPIIYRDMKPANLMLDEKHNKIMLVDFGIARLVAPTQKGVTAIGTMGYAPPELFSGSVERRSDIYSLGATMFHMLTGTDPQTNPLLIFDFNKNPKPSQINPAITPTMDAILMKMVAHRPEDRHASAAELKTILETHEHRLSHPHGTGEVDLRSGMHVGPPCSSCGHPVPPEMMFCGHCGAKQGQPQQKPIPRVSVIGPSGPMASFLLDKESHLIGRANPVAMIFPEVDLSGHDPTTKVSRRHARIYTQGDNLLLEDLSSANGTVVNGTTRLVPGQPYRLKHGDEIRLGDTLLRLTIEH